jgi:hypothetical protein
MDFITDFNRLEGDTMTESSRLGSATDNPTHSHRCYAAGVPIAYALLCPHHCALRQYHDGLAGSSAVQLEHADEKGNSGTPSFRLFRGRPCT